MKYYELYNTKTIKPVLQRVKMKNALEYWSSDELPVAKYTWVYGPKKPRDQLRLREMSPRDVSLEKLVQNNIVRLLDPVEVNNVSDAGRLSDEADAYIIGDMEDWLTDEDTLEAIARRNKPLIAEWDHWGYSIHGRLSRYRLNRFEKVKYLIPMGHEDVNKIIAALKALRFLRHMKILYVGEYPPRSVTAPKDLTFKNIEDRFGIRITKTSFQEYLETIKNTPINKAEETAKLWLEKYSVDEHLRKDLAE